MGTFRFAAYLVALTLLTGNLVLAADPVTGNAAGQPKLQAGLAYEYFGDPALERLQEAGSAPDVGPMDKGHNDWGLRFTGLLMPPADGEYAFRAEANTGVRVKINNALVIDGWARDAARTGKATLAKDKPIPIVVEYFFNRGKGGGKAELRLFWTPPGGKEEPVPTTAYSQPLMVEATLVRVSKAPKLADIAPYREALVIYEYRVDKVVLGPVSAGNIRVAHWGIYDRLDQAVLNDQPGQKRNSLALLPFDRAGATVEQAKTSDTLEVDLDVPYYFDLGQRLVGKAGLQQDNARPWDYGTSWSEKMGWFFPVHGQLRLVAVGDSRTMAGIDARRFFQPENLRHPVAFNLAIGSAGTDMVELQTREYALRLPRLEWIVWGLSPRVFNRRWNDVMKDRLINSPGYRYDRDNPELVWKKDSAGMVMPVPRPVAAGDSVAWGFKEVPPAGDWSGDFKALGARARIQGVLQKPNFEYAEDRMQRFAGLLRDLEARNIRVLGFIPPQHYFTKGQPCTDDDGTTREGYDRIVTALNELARRQPNFLFLDIDRKGENDFQDEDFANFDHLSGKGAAKLARMLDRAISDSAKGGSVR